MPPIFRAPVLSLASQGTGVLQLIALLWRYGPSNATDTYFYLFNLGNLPIQILIVGVMYPMLLNDSRLTRRGARRFALSVPFVALLAVGAGSAWLWFNGRVDADTIPIIALSAINAMLQAILWYHAVSAEAGGQPQWISGIALPANVLATIAIAFPWGSSTNTVTAMMIALTTANAIFVVVALKLRVGARVIDGLPESSNSRARAPFWFLAKSGVSYGGLMVIQSLSLVLPPATLTLLTVPMKIVASVSATFVNAILPALIHQTTDSPSAGRKFLRTLVGVLGACGVVGVIGVGVLSPEYTLVALVVALWLLASASSSVAQRLAFRFLPPSASRITILVVPVIVIAVAVSSGMDGFGLLALLAAYAAVDAVSSFLLLATMKDRVMACVTGAVAGALATIWYLSLIWELGVS